MSTRLRARVTLLLGASLAAVIGLVVQGSALGSRGPVVRHGHPERASMGRLHGEHVRREVRAREEARLQVKITKITEIPVFRRWPTARSTPCSRTGTTSTSTSSTSTKQKTVVLVGSNGLAGHIGWFIPKYLLKQYPQFKTWRGLKGKESVFKTAESGSQGMFLGGDPSYVQKDKELIELLGLNFKHVTVGAEPAEVARFTQLIKQKKPVIFYWWTPQYLNRSLDLVRGEAAGALQGLPGRRERRRRHQVQVRVLDVPAQQAVQQEVHPERLSRRQGAPEVQVVERRPEPRRQAIAGDKEKPEKAAEKWVKATRPRSTPGSSDEPDTGGGLTSPARRRRR